VSIDRQMHLSCSLLRPQIWQEIDYSRPVGVFTFQQTLLTIALGIAWQIVFTLMFDPYIFLCIVLFRLIGHKETTVFASDISCSGSAHDASDHEPRHAIKQDLAITSLRYNRCICLRPVSIDAKYSFMECSVFVE
jgi:hypothetical protein